MLLKSQSRTLRCVQRLGKIDSTENYNWSQRHADCLCTRLLSFETFYDLLQCRPTHIFQMRSTAFCRLYLLIVDTYLLLRWKP
jgi:hypothetical protein